MTIRKYAHGEVIETEAEPAEPIRSEADARPEPEREVDPEFASDEDYQ